MNNTSALRGCRFVCGAAMLVGLVSCCELAWAQPSVRHSTWQTSYGEYHGGAYDTAQSTKAALTFDGDRGYYKTRRGTGRLYDVHYTSVGDGEFLIAAKWSFLGQRGWVHFHIDHANQSLTGHWGRTDRIAGYWNSVSPTAGPYSQQQRQTTRHPSDLPPV